MNIRQDDDWLIGAPPFSFDREFEVKINGQTRRCKRTMAFGSNDLIFTDCTHPEQNVLCCESYIEAYRHMTP